MNSKVLIVTGMHRSGTSLVSKYLMECGLFFGNKLLNENNLKECNTYGGHHEDLEFLTFHNEILKKSKANIFDRTVKFGFPTRNLNLHFRKNEIVKAENIIDSRNRLSQWGWKDPRTTLFLNFWNDRLENPFFLFLIRNPATVVNSLIKRNKNIAITKNPKIGFKSCIVFNQEIHKFVTANKDRSVIIDIDNIVLSQIDLIYLLQDKFGIILEKKKLSDLINPQAFKLSKNINIDRLIGEERNKNCKKEILESYEIYNKLKKMSVQNAFLN